MRTTPPTAAIALALVAGLSLAACSGTPSAGAGSTSATVSAGADAAATATHATARATTEGPDLLTDPTADPTTGAAAESATSAPAGSPTADGGKVAGRGSTHACALITQQEAAVALGADPGAGEETTQQGASTCLFGQSPSLVTVNIVPTGGKAALDHLRAQAPAGRLTTVDGIGDVAYGFSGGPSAGVWFTKGDALLVVAIVATAAPTPVKDAATTLARLAAGRI